MPRSRFVSAVRRGGSARGPDAEAARRRPSRLAVGQVLDTYGRAGALACGSSTNTWPTSASYLSRSPQRRRPDAAPSRTAHSGSFGTGPCASTKLARAVSYGFRTPFGGRSIIVRTVPAEFSGRPARLPSFSRSRRLAHGRSQRGAPRADRRMAQRSGESRSAPFDRRDGVALARLAECETLPVRTVACRSGNRPQRAGAPVWAEVA